MASVPFMTSSTMPADRMITPSQGVRPVRDWIMLPAVALMTPRTISSKMT